MTKTKYRVTQSFFHAGAMLAVDSPVWMTAAQAKYLGHCTEVWTDPAPVIVVTEATAKAEAEPAAPKEAKKAAK